MDARKKKLLSDLVMQTRDTLGPGYHYAALWVKHGGTIGDSYWVHTLAALMDKRGL